MFSLEASQRKPESNLVPVLSARALREPVRHLAKPGIAKGARLVAALVPPASIGGTNAPYDVLAVWSGIPLDDVSSSEIPYSGYIVGRYIGGGRMTGTPLTETAFYILLALRHPNHGYGITQDAARLTNGRVQIGAGTLYGALQGMLEKGWIRLYSKEGGSRKKKEYALTELGKSVFDAEVERMRLALDNAREMYHDDEV